MEILIFNHRLVQWSGGKISKELQEMDQYAQETCQEFQEVQETCQGIQEMTFTGHIRWFPGPFFYGNIDILPPRSLN